MIDASLTSLLAAAQSVSCFLVPDKGRKNTK